jgi:hypothetical protein
MENHVNPNDNETRSELQSDVIIREDYETIEEWTIDIDKDNIRSKEKRVMRGIIQKRKIHHNDGKSIFSEFTNKIISLLKDLPLMIWLKQLFR